MLIDHQLMTISATNVSQRCLLTYLIKLRDDILVAIVSSESSAFVALEMGLRYVTVVHDILEDVMGYGVVGTVQTICQLTILGILDSPRRVIFEFCEARFQFDGNFFALRAPAPSD